MTKFQGICVAFWLGLTVLIFLTPRNKVGTLFDILDAIFFTALILIGVFLYVFSVLLPRRRRRKDPTWVDPSWILRTDPQSAQTGPPPTRRRLNLPEGRWWETPSRTDRRDPPQPPRG